MLDKTPARPMRVQPTPSIAIAIGLGYAVLFMVVQLISGVDYDEIGADSNSLIDGLVIPMVICTAAVVAAVTALGWWRPATFEVKRADIGPAKAIAPLMLLAVLLGINWGGLGDIGGEYLLWLGLGCLMVGFSEEMVYRGLALTGARSGWSELQAWLTASILFAVLHSVNAVLGQDIGPTIKQMGAAFVIGSIFYAVRRTTGTVIVGMALHAVFDFGVFTHSGDAGAATTAEPTFSTAGQGFAVALQVICLVLFVVSAKRLFATDRTAAAAAESTTLAV
jgi:membrane protease YdiL (CAAX protease family)